MKKLFLLLAAIITFSLSVMAQDQRVEGVVVSADNGEPLVGASVLGVGTHTGITTDLDGQFSFTLPKSVKKLQVSYVGMTTREVDITPGKMTIQLESSNLLDEVITIAYGTAKRSAYTGAASVINADEIENRLVSNFTDALNGVVAGVQTLSTTGQPGTSATVRIRGIGSINASMTPLYVLDGVPYSGDMAAINPADIESMVVLKDAAAAALYGARGANGVIQITTKRGKQGEAKVTFDAKWGGNSRQVTNYNVIESPEQFLELTYAAARNNALYNLGYTTQAAHEYANGRIIPNTGYQVFTVPAGQNLIGTNGRFNPNATRGYSDGKYYYTPDNWADGTFRNGLRQEYNVAVSGATDRLNYYVSANYLEDEGIIDNSSYSRLTSRASIDYQAKKWLKIGTNITYAYGDMKAPSEQTNTNGSGNAFFLANTIAPIYPLYVRNAKGEVMYDQSTGHPIYDYGDGNSSAATRPFMTQACPPSQLLYDVDQAMTDYFDAKWYVVLTPVTGLSITGNAALNIDNTRTHTVLNGLYGQFASMGGQAIQQSSRSKDLTLQLLANYSHSIGDDHHLAYMLAAETYNMNLEDVAASGTNLYNPFNWTVNNTLKNSQRTGSGSYGEVSRRAFFGRINYDFQNRYFASFSYRREASSIFAPDKRWGSFFAISAGWDIAKESFMQPFTAVDQLKLRASYGQQGNDGIGNSYAYLDQYTLTGSNDWSDGKLAYKGNPELTWEKSNSTDVGLDFSFWQGMLAGSIDYFNRQTSDMLYNKPVPPSLGYSSIPMNVGSMRNSGLEIELRYRPISTKNITWDINFNGTLISNKILELHPDLNGVLKSGSRILEEGESIYRYNLVKYAGVDPASGKALYWAWENDENGNRKPGSDYVTDVYDASFRQPTDNLLPKFYGGFGTSLNAYGFDVSIQFAYQLGGKTWDEGYQQAMHGGTSGDFGRNWHSDILNAWTPENRFTDVPRLDTGDSFANADSDRWIISSNYLALNNITFGYTIPSNITRRIGIETVRVFGAADNVALWSARKGLDPRMSYILATTSSYTAARCISGGIKVVF